jgi:Xaa-Pro aminopeptidase
VKTLALSLLLLPAQAAPAAPGSSPRPDGWRALEEHGLAPLRYRLVLPTDFDAARAWPVLLVLPPGGQDEAMVERALELYFEREARQRGWVVVAPAAPAGTSFVGGAEGRLPALLDALARELRAEGGGVHLAGVSNGGRAAFRLAGLHAERFLSLTVLPGAPASAEDRARLAGLARLPVTLFVGEKDEGWHAEALEVAAELETLGARDVRLEVRAGEGHVLAADVGRLVFERLETLRCSSAGRVGPPEQRFLDWTGLQFAPEVHARRRERLARALRPEGGGVFLAPSREGTSSGETFRQTDDYLYLSGLELPRSVLALEVEGARCTLFAPERDARFESAARPNDFPGRPLAADPSLARVAGVDALLPLSALEVALAGWVEAGQALWIDPGPAGLAAPGPPAPFAQEGEGPALERYLRARFPAARLRDAHAAVARLRMRKGPEELALIRRACAVTVEGIRAAARAIRPGVDERTLAGVLEAAFKAGGAQRPAFDPIVKSGPNSLWPWRILAAHYGRRNRSLAAGELVILDVGCEVDHYASDVGRTFPVSGRFTADQARRLRMVTACADAVLAAVRPGVTLGELRAVAQASLPPEERRHVQTGTFYGHHVGLDAGDPSLLEEPLEPGMVFTIEPWYYDHEDGVAVFVEDVILVTESGAENLTAELPRGVEELERMVGAR